MESEEVTLKQIAWGSLLWFSAGDWNIIFS